MKRLAVLTLLLGGCYGRPSPETCYEKYVEGRRASDEGYRVCMAEYRRRNGMATEADWYLLDSRNAKHRRRAPGVVVQVENSISTPPAAPAAQTAPAMPKDCVRWECRASDAGQSCNCLEIVTPQSGEISGL